MRYNKSPKFRKNPNIKNRIYKNDTSFKDVIETMISYLKLATTIGFIAASIFVFNVFKTYQFIGALDNLSSSIILIVGATLMLGTLTLFNILSFFFIFLIIFGYPYLIFGICDRLPKLLRIAISLQIVVIIGLLCYCFYNFSSNSFTYISILLIMFAIIADWIRYKFKKNLFYNTDLSNLFNKIFGDVACTLLSIIGTVSILLTFYVCYYNIPHHDNIEVFSAVGYAIAIPSMMILLFIRSGNKHIKVLLSFMLAGSPLLVPQLSSKLIENIMSEVIFYRQSQFHNVIEIDKACYSSNLDKIQSSDFNFQINSGGYYVCFTESNSIYENKLILLGSSKIIAKERESDNVVINVINLSSCQTVEPIYYTSRCIIVEESVAINSVKVSNKSKSSSNEIIKTNISDAYVPITGVDKMNNSLGGLSGKYTKKMTNSGNTYNYNTYNYYMSESKFHNEHSVNKSSCDR